MYDSVCEKRLLWLIQFVKRDFHSCSQQLIRTQKKMHFVTVGGMCNSTNVYLASAHTATSHVMYNFEKCFPRFCRELVRCG